MLCSWLPEDLKIEAVRLLTDSGIDSTNRERKVREAYFEIIVFSIILMFVLLLLYACMLW